MKYTFFFIIMSLEEFLTNPTNSLDTYTELTWNIKNAHYLISHACHIMTLVEKGKYNELSAYLEKKESYLELLKELDVLTDKYNLHIEPDEYKDTGQMICHYTLLEYADKLMARDETWNINN